jgi:hypothetical protein
MAKHTYPRDLHAILRTQWNSEPLAEGWPRVDLPEKAVLDEFLDVCYHASLMAEEGRPTVFRVAFISSESPVSPPRNEPIALETITRYALGQPVPFTAGELRRLAPVADPRRILIAVEQIGDGAQRRLQIYGLIDTGMGLWEMARHERVMGTASPQAFVVASTRPGELIISRGDHPVIRVRAGEVVSPAKSVLFRGPVAQFFINASDQLIREACERSGVNQDPAEDDGLSFAHLEFIESILLYSAELEHGGALLFVPEDVADDDPRLDAVSIKYRLQSTRPRDALLAAMAARLEKNATHERLHDRQTVKNEELEELEALEWQQHNLEDSALDAARFIASLTAVDGAVVVTDKLRIIGFGAEVRVSGGPGTDTIHVAKDADGGDLAAAAFTGYGTRHRSAFRFVESVTPSVAFIMSQDGGIKAATKVGEKVVMWPYFEVGYTTELS